MSLTILNPLYFQETKNAIVEVHADDTDVAIMLVHHWNEQLNDIVFCAHQSKKTWSIKESSLTLIAEVKAVLPFIHAFSGCDSTSALFGIGKVTILKKFKGTTIYGKYFLFTYILQAATNFSKMPKH